MNSSIAKDAKERHSIAILRHDIEQAAAKARVVYGAGITPLGLLMAELHVICEAAPLYVRLNLEASIATFETRVCGDAVQDTNRPGHVDPGAPR